MRISLALRYAAGNKSRTAAIILTAALSMLILFASMIYSRAVEARFLDTIAVEAENADIGIVYSSKSDTRIITDSPLKDYAERLEFAVGVLELYGTSEIGGELQYIALRGITSEGFGLINNTVKIAGPDREIRQDEVIISRSTANALNLGIDSRIEVSVGSKTKSFYIASIVEDAGCFELPGAYVVYAREDFIGSYVGAPFGGVFNKIFVKAKDGEDIDTLMSDFAAIPEYENYKVELENDTAVYISRANKLALPISIGTASCAFLAIFLIYLIINAGFKRRTGEIAGLKAIGADNGFIISVFMLENLLYILAGAAIGVLLCIIIATAVFPAISSVALAADYYLPRMFAALATVTLSILLLTLPPIIRCRFVSVRKASVESGNTLLKNNVPLTLIGIAAVAAAYVLLLGEYYSYALGIAALILAAGGGIIAVPYLVQQASVWLSESKFIFGIPSLAAKSLKSERNIAGSVRILLAGIIVCSLIVSAAAVTLNIGRGLIADVDCDIIVSNVRSGGAQLDTISGMEGIYDVYSFYYEKGSITGGGESYDLNVFGAEYSDLAFMGDYEQISSEETIAGALSSGGGIILDYSYYKLRKIKEGDTVSVELNGIIADMRVLGFYQSYQYSGKTALINPGYLAETFGSDAYNTIICKAEGDTGEAVQRIRAAFGGSNLIAVSKDEAYGVYLELIEGTVLFARYFAYIVAAICSVSVLANVKNSRNERKRMRYQLYSLGISRGGLTLMELIENLFSGAVVLIVAAVILPVVGLAAANIASGSGVYAPSAILFPTSAAIAAVYYAAYILIALTSYNNLDKKELISVIKDT